MTDLEMTLLCAEAMGIDVWEGIGGGLFVWPNQEKRYDPLHDDAQAMALVKRFDVTIERDEGKTYGVTLFYSRYEDWRPDYAAGLPRFIVRDCPDLNRAIVECVAKMQESRHE